MDVRALATDSDATFSEGNSIVVKSVFVLIFEFSTSKIYITEKSNLYNMHLQICNI